MARGGRRYSRELVSRSARVALVLVLLGTLGQAVSLVSRGRRGDSDFGVFHRTTQLLAGGIGSDLYPRLDVVTTWPISLSPTGLAIFQPLAGLSPVMASAVWAGVNLVLLGISFVVLRDLLTRTGDARSNEFFAWATVILLVLSSGSIQVGQFSVLFVACWIVSLSALAAGRPFSALLLLALPSAIKLYPAMMLAIPLSLVRNVRAGFHQIVQFAVALVIMCLIVPVAMYGSNGWTLNVSFWRNVILSPAGQVQYMQTVRHSNQSLDTLLLRYFSYEPDFHDLFLNVPHFWLDKGDVVAVANIVRLLIVLGTVAAVWRWRRTPRDLSSRDDLLTMAGLWSSTLYLMLPETKARYAVYAFLGFLPLLKRAATIGGEATRAARARPWVEVAVLIVLILVTLPASVQVYGVGFLGAALLWAANIRHARLANR
ncbi:MAG TPA: glycosyltransferase family 87 protein [Vicinamibacterales bacterium]|jgi:hypothetical protein|nr:glycosyltransferase family 87 protein [Vicinamibacterales bacterium]